MLRVFFLLVLLTIGQPCHTVRVVDVSAETPDKALAATDEHMLRFRNQARTNSESGPYGQAQKTQPKPRKTATAGRACLAGNELRAGMSLRLESKQLPGRFMYQKQGDQQNADTGGPINFQKMAVPVKFPLSLHEKETHIFGSDYQLTAQGTTFQMELEKKSDNSTRKEEIRSGDRVRLRDAEGRYLALDCRTMWPSIMRAEKAGDIDDESRTFEVVHAFEPRFLPVNQASKIAGIYFGKGAAGTDAEWHKDPAKSASICDGDEIFLRQRDCYSPHVKTKNCPTCNDSPTLNWGEYQYLYTYQQLPGHPPKEHLGFLHHMPGYPGDMELMTQKNWATAKYDPNATGSRFRLQFDK